MDVSALDFQQGKIKIFLLRSKIRSGLYGSQVDKSFCSAMQSPLGEWFYTVCLPKYGHIPEVREMEKLNRETHNICSRISDLQQKGKIIEARDKMNELLVVSDNFLKTLESVAERVL